MGLRLLLVEQDGVVLAAKMPGKIKTYSVYCNTLTLNNVILLFEYSIWPNTVIYLLVLYIYSGADYFIQGRDVFSDSLNR